MCARIGAALILFVAAAAHALPPEEVVVEARAATAPDPLSTPASVTVVDLEGLPASADVAQVLDSAAGTTVQELGGLGAWSAVSIRGSTLRQVQVCIDGIPLNPDGASVVNLSELPIGAFSRVELWRGNAPAELGAGAMGGVVNLVTADRRAESATATVGSFGTGRIGGAVTSSGTLAGRPASGFAYVEGFGSDGDFTYFSDGGTPYERLDDHLRTRANADRTQLAANVAVRVGDDRLRVALIDTFLARDEGVPGHANQPTVQTRLGTVRNLTAVQADTTTGVTRTRVRVWGQTRRERLDDGGGELGVGAWRTEDTASSTGALVDVRFAPTAQVVPSATIEARRDGHRAVDLLAGTSTDPRSRHALVATAAATLLLADDRVQLAPVVQAQWLDSRALGKRHDGLSERPAAADTLVVANPRLGVLVRPVPQLALKGNVGRYVRPPDLSELFGHHGTQLGNSGLVPERGLSWDLGLRAEPGDAAFDLTLFGSESRDLISLVQNGQRLLVPVNIGRARVMGAETAADVVAFGFVTSATRFTAMRTVNLSDDPAYRGNALPRMPGLELDQATSVSWRAVRFGHGFGYTAAHTWDATGWYQSAPRGLHRAFVGVDPGGGWPAVSLDVLNLTDRLVEIVPRNPLDPGDTALVAQSITDFAGYPLPGRTVLLSVRFTPEERP